MFEALGLRDIELIGTPRDAARALAALGQRNVVGFDTESKPTFVKNEAQAGPHTVQFAAMDRAWVFQLHDADCRASAACLLASSALTKVGFGLSSDRTQIRNKLGVEAQAVLDLDTVFRRRGHRSSVGVKTAVALVFGQRFVKSRKPRRTGPAGSSVKDNWAMPRTMRMRRCGCSRRWGRRRGGTGEGWRGGRRDRGLRTVTARWSGLLIRAAEICCALPSAHFVAGLAEWPAVQCVRHFHLDSNGQDRALIAMLQFMSLTVDNLKYCHRSLRSFFARWRAAFPKLVNHLPWVRTRSAFCATEETASFPHGCDW